MTHPRNESWYQLELEVSPEASPSQRGDLENIISVVGGLKHRYRHDARRAAERLSEQAVIHSVIMVLCTEQAQFIWKNDQREDLR